MKIFQIFFYFEQNIKKKSLSKEFFEKLNFKSHIQSIKFSLYEVF
jgi:hypothetical protein